MRPPLEEVAATLRPSDLGGVATAAAAAAAREETGRQPRAPPATSEERVAVGSRVNWVHLCGDEAIARGRAEATERQRLGRALIAKEEQLAAAKARAVENAAELQALRIFKAEKDREAASPYSDASSTTVRPTSNRFTPASVHSPTCAMHESARPVAADASCAAARAVARLPGCFSFRRRWPPPPPPVRRRSCRRIIVRSFSTSAPISARMAG